MSRGPKVYLSVKLTSCLTIYQLVIIYQLSISYLSPFYRLSISYPCYPILSCPVPSWPQLRSLPMLVPGPCPKESPAPARASGCEKNPVPGSKRRLRDACKKTLDWIDYWIVHVTTYC